MTTRPIRGFKARSRKYAEVFIRVYREHNDYEEARRIASDWVDYGMGGIKPDERVWVREAIGNEKEA